MIKNSSKTSLVLYAVIWVMCCPFVSAQTTEANQADSPVDEAAINSIKDPFDPAVQVPALVEFFLQEIREAKARELAAKAQEVQVVAVEDRQPEPSSTVADVLPKSPDPVVLPELKVSGIVFNAPQPRAIINGKVVGIGDVVDEVKILQIGKGRIDVQYRGVDNVVQFNNE